MEQTEDYRLTTFDNPFDPFDQFVQWLLYDNEHNYHTCELIDRLSNFRDDMSEKEIESEHRRVIDEIIDNDVRNIYKKVQRKAAVQTA